MKSFLSLTFFRLAAALHGKCRESDLYVNCPVFTPDGKRTSKYSQRACRVCGSTEEFPYNRYQYAYERTKGDGEFCELCGKVDGLEAIPMGCAARITTACPKCRGVAVTV